MREGEVGGQQLHGAAESLVVPGAEAHHGLAEHAPGRERGAPGHGPQALGGPPPVTRVHGVEAPHDRLRVPPQGVARIEGVEAAPASADHEQVRQHPFHPGRGRPGGEGLRVDGQRIGPVQVADVEDQGLVLQHLDGDDRPVPGGLGPHRGGFPFEAAPCQLPGPLDGGAEAEQRQFFRATVPGRHLPEPVEGAAPIPPGQELPHLIQQIGGGDVLRPRTFPPSLSAAVLAGRHACVVRESLGGSAGLRRRSARRKTAESLHSSTRAPR